MSVAIKKNRFSPFEKCRPFSGQISWSTKMYLGFKLKEMLLYCGMKSLEMKKVIELYTVLALFKSDIRRKFPFVSSLTGWRMRNLFIITPTQKLRPKHIYRYAIGLDVCKKEHEKQHRNHWLLFLNTFNRLLCNIFA